MSVSARERIESRKQILAHGKERPAIPRPQGKAYLLEEFDPAGLVKIVDGQNFFELIKDQHRRLTLAGERRLPCRQVIGKSRLG